MSEVDFLSEVGTRIRKIRISKKITETKLASMCGMDLSSMSRIETGKTNVTLITLLKISVALGVSVFNLLKDEDQGTLQAVAPFNNANP